MVTAPILFYLMCAIIVVFYKGVQFIQKTALDRWTIELAGRLAERLKETLEVVVDHLHPSNEGRLLKTDARDLFYNDFMKTYKDKDKDKVLGALADRMSEVTVDLSHPSLIERTLKVEPYLSGLADKQVEIARRKTLPEPSSFKDFFKFTGLYRLHDLLAWRSSPAFTPGFAEAWKRPNPDEHYTWKVWLVRAIALCGVVSSAVIFWRIYKGKQLAPIPFFGKSIVLNLLIHAIVVWALLRIFFSTTAFSIESIVFSVGYIGFKSFVEDHVKSIDTYLAARAKAPSPAEIQKLEYLKPPEIEFPDRQDFPAHLVYQKPEDMKEMRKWLKLWLKHEAMPDWTRKYNVGKAALSAMFTMDNFPITWTLQKLITDKISFGLVLECVIITTVILIGFDLAKVSIVRSKLFAKHSTEMGVVFGAVLAVIFTFFIALFSLNCMRQSRDLVKRVYEKWASKWKPLHAEMYRSMFMELDSEPKTTPQRGGGLELLQDGGASILDSLNSFVKEIKKEFPEDGDPLTFAAHLATRPEVIRGVARYAPLIDKAVDLPLVRELTNDDEKKVLRGVLKSPAVLEFVADHAHVLRKAIDQNILQKVKEDPKSILAHTDFLKDVVGAIESRPSVIGAVARMPFVASFLEEQPVARQILKGVQKNPSILQTVLEQADLIQEMVNTRTIEAMFNNEKIMQRLVAAPQLLAFAASLPIAHQYIRMFPMLGDILKNFMKSANYKRIDKLVPFLDWMTYTPPNTEIKALLPFKEIAKRLLGKGNPYTFRLILLVVVTLVGVLIYQAIYNEVMRRKAFKKGDKATNPAELQKRKDTVDALMTVLKWIVCVVSVFMFIYWRLDGVA